MIVTAEHTTALRVTRVINAPRERIFEAWTTPADIMKWFAPETCHVLSAKINLRPGGDYHFRVKSEEKGEINLSGVFREVKRPSNLVYTWGVSGHPKLEFGDSQVTVEFLDRKDATEIQITHEQLPNEEVKEDQSNRLGRHTSEGPRSGNTLLLSGARRSDQEGAARGHEFCHAAAYGRAWSEWLSYHGLRRSQERTVAARAIALFQLSGAA
jgi:uncharacterized protein YndB with AHSA1/START domain